ncbi:hypothetical protein QR98_0042890 [Sarcoptes scabiei]|uniref:Uncharacterized protein n=1 Tax=Sarcoptes scabiei TaxID=52283 RepID=A0A132A4A6_SARSC|nr:hypothetical protein QR98_0042890 [Sarcoptes scabiei]
MFSRHSKKSSKTISTIKSGDAGGAFDPRKVNQQFNETDVGQQQSMQKSVQSAAYNLFRSPPPPMPPPPSLSEVSVQNGLIVMKRGNLYRKVESKATIVHHSFVRNA